MSTDVPAVWRRVSLHLDAVKSANDFIPFINAARDWFDNAVAVNAYVDSETGELIIEQKYV